MTGRDNEDFRKLILMDDTFSLRYLLDLGEGVLDGAGEETTAYVVGQRQSSNCFIFDNREKLDKRLGFQHHARAIPRGLFSNHPNHEILYELDIGQLQSLATDAKLEPTLAAVTFGKAVLKAIDRIESSDETAQLFATPIADGQKIASEYFEAISRLSDSLNEIGYSLDDEVIKLQGELVQSRLKKVVSLERYQSFALGVLFGRWKLQPVDRPIEVFGEFDGVGAVSPARLKSRDSSHTGNRIAFLEDDCAFGMNRLSGMVNDLVHQFSKQGVPFTSQELSRIDSFRSVEFFISICRSTLAADEKRPFVYR